MDCRDAQERILELSMTGPGCERGALDGHVSTCPECARFAELQRRLDARLTSAIPPARLGPAFRSSLRKKMRRDEASAWPDFLPDVAHLVGCAAGSVLAVAAVPAYAGAVLGIGGAFTVVTYFFQAVVRS